MDKYFIARLKRILILVCAFIIYSMQPSTAARFENLSIENGLSQNTVFDIKQDKFGRLWIGTYGGLNLYDGIKFTHFTSKLTPNNANYALSSSSIYGITIDENGNLWLSTQKGLTFLDIHTFETKRFVHDPNSSNSLPSNTIRASSFDSQNQLWLATYGGLTKYDLQSNRFTVYLDNRDIDPIQKCSSKIRAILHDSSGHIWAGDANKGLCRFNPETEEFIRIDYHNSPRESASVGIRSIFQDSPEQVWIGSTNGFFHYNIKTAQSTGYFHNPDDISSLPNNWIQRIIKHDHQHLWVATTRGLGLFNKQTASFTNFETIPGSKSGLSSNSLFSVFRDRSGLLWIGTENSGIDKYNPRQTQFSTASQTGLSGHQLSSNLIWGVVKAYGYIWLATTEGLNRIDPNSGKVKVYQYDPNNINSIPTNNLYKVVAGRNRHIWVASSSGIARLNIDTEKFTRYQHQAENPKSLPFNNIISILEDSDNNLWLGSFSEGLAMVNFQKNIFNHYVYNPNNINSISDNFINEIIQSGQGHYWFSTRDGLSRYNPGTNTFDRPTQGILPDKTLINAMRFNKNNEMIMASNKGVYIFNPASGELKNYGIEDGLSNDHIYSIELDQQGQIWASSNFGFSRINPVKNEIKNFDVFDGLQGYEFNSASSFNDGTNIYFGGFEGLTYFNPENITISNFKPPVMITNFTVPGKTFKTADLQKPINISYKDTYFSIEFSALDYTDPKKNTYRYKLEGYDNKWIDSGNRNYSAYTNLDGGNYTFRVKAANKYGIWNEKGTSIKLIVTPPYWETQWFRTLFGISLIAIIITIYWLRVRAVHAHNKELEEEVKARTADLEKTLVELGETKDALIESAHKAGMADSATGVLHNVGNLLNSVNTSASLIRETIDSSISNKFLRANELLIKNISDIEEFIINNPKGKPLLNYYVELDTPFRAEHSKLSENAARLIKNIASIKETIAAQHRYAKGHQLIEELSVINIIEDTLLLQSGSIGRHEIKIHKHYDQNLPNIKIQKIKLVQILLNLYKNAKESMDEAATTENHLTIETYQDQQHVYIKITDTGLGIPHDQLEAIFAYGYSTKIEGHGFGLHSCANYMTEMHGEMWAESKGIGYGATFILKFPIDRNEQVQEHRKAS